jgi:hypothetical protein
LLAFQVTDQIPNNPYKTETYATFPDVPPDGDGFRRIEPSTRRLAVTHQLRWSIDWQILAVITHQWHVNRANNLKQRDSSQNQNPPSHSTSV